MACCVACASASSRLGIVANQPQAARERLARAGIGDLFEYQGLSGLTGFSKPDPRAFEAAAEALGLKPADCAMVGDRIDNDIVPAKALGMATILLRGGRHRRQRPRSPVEEPDAVVTDVLELEAAVNALLSIPSLAPALNDAERRDDLPVAVARAVGCRAS